MEGGCSASSTNPKAAGSGGGASRFLANLPSRGLFSSSAAVVPSNPGGMRVYVCDHETAPPEDQNIKTNQKNILIRSLMLKNHKTDSKDGKAASGSRKRPAEKVLDGKAVGKKAMTSEAGSSSLLPRDLQTLTVERLRVLLRERGLSVKGRKDELISRLRAVNS